MYIVTFISCAKFITLVAFIHGFACGLPWKELYIIMDGIIKYSSTIYIGSMKVRGFWPKIITTKTSDIYFQMVLVWEY